MYVVNKIAGWLLSPVAPGLLLVLSAAVAVWLNRRRTAFWLMLAAAAWQWVWGTAAWCRLIGLPLERIYPVVKAEDSPEADAIVVLGGGMASNPDIYPYADMSEGADRVWHAARLYRAGKAPLVVPTGCSDMDSTVPLLVDLGVPREAIRVENAARNTEENARFAASLLADAIKGRRPKVLLVTSAQHMRRAMLMYSRYAPGLDIIPVATDYNVTVCTDRPFKISDFFPNTDYQQKNGCLLKELVGYWGYRIFRR